MEIRKGWRALPWRMIALGFVVSLPVLFGIVGRLRKHWWGFFGDFQAVVCSGRASLAQIDLYSAYTSAECTAVGSKPFIYMPVIADAAGATEVFLGPQVMFWLYAALYAGSLAVLLSLLLFDRSAPKPLFGRVLAVGLITGGSVLWGNVAIVLHAAIALTARIAFRLPAVFLLVVAAAALIKPVFATYLLVFLLAPWPLAKRVSWFGVGSVVAMAPTAWFALTGGALFERWRGSVEDMVFDGLPGDGLFAISGLLGFDSSSLGVGVAHVVFAALLVAACMVLASRAKLSNMDRVWLALTGACMLDPRFGAYDVLLLVPGAMVAANAARKLGASRLYENIVYGGCAAALCLNIFDLSDYGNKVAFVCLTLSLFMAATYAFRTTSARGLLPAEALPGPGSAAAAAAARVPTPTV